MSSSPAVEPSSPSTTTPSSPALRANDHGQFQTSTPNYVNKKQYHPPLNVILPATAPGTPPTFGRPSGQGLSECRVLSTARRADLDAAAKVARGSAATPASGDGRGHPPDGTSSDKSSETAAGVSRTPSTALSRKESYKAQRQHYRREKKRAASALLHSIEDPTVVVLADWLKVRGSLKSWTKLWCVLKPGLLLLYKSPKAKSSHWVGTVLLTSCRVIERPSKKDGFCFKLYHPLEQSIWAPRGPHNETIGAVVQPLPTAHLIFRAPSQAAGHCWLDGLELALRCSNAMLRCSRSRPEQTVEPEAPATQTNISHEELEKHFNEHVKQVDLSTRSSPIPVTSPPDQTPGRCRSADPRPKKAKAGRGSVWAQFVESIETLAREHDTSDSQSPESEKRDPGFLDFLRKRDERPAPEAIAQKRLSKSLASSPLRVDAPRRSPILRYFDLPKLPVQVDRSRRRLPSSSTLDEGLDKPPSPKRRSSTPCTLKSKLARQRISDLRRTGFKTDTENDEAPKRVAGGSEVLCDAPGSVLITKTAPSVERFACSSSSTSDGCDGKPDGASYRHGSPSVGKFSLIDYAKLPSASFETVQSERRGNRLSSQSVYVTGKVLESGR
ncbi:unnamed protein product, partial [Iphiclides podalirius]